jgi:hypothetical protein
MARPRTDIESGTAYGPLETDAAADADVSSDDDTRGLTTGAPSNAPTTRSQHALSRSEITQGIANRFVHSRAYMVLYLIMALLATATVALSAGSGCPGPAFYVLEVIVNGAMVCEVVVRMIAYGRAFWKSPFSIVDVGVTLFCTVTLLVLAFAGCGTVSKEEEMFDTLLLIARNVLQFVRLATVIRQSGHSIFSAPKPLDLSAARRRAGYSSLDLDLDLSDSDAPGTTDELGRPLVAPQREQTFDPRRRSQTEMPRAQQAVRERDEEDMWAELG